MNLKIKFIIKSLIPPALLGLSLFFLWEFTHNTDLMLIGRLGTVTFFIWLFIKTRKIIKNLPHDSLTFNPNILTLTLGLFIIGWIIFSITDYLFHLPVDWIDIYVLGIIITPISMGLLPLWTRDNKWR